LLAKPAEEAHMLFASKRTVHWYAEKFDRTCPSIQEEKWPKLSDDSDNHWSMHHSHTDHANPSIVEALSL